MTTWESIAGEKSLASLPSCLREVRSDRSKQNCCLGSFHPLHRYLFAYAALCAKPKAPKFALAGGIDFVFCLPVTAYWLTPRPLGRNADVPNSRIPNAGISILRLHPRPSIGSGASSHRCSEGIRTRSWRPLTLMLKHRAGSVSSSRKSRASSLACCAAQTAHEDQQVAALLMLCPALLAGSCGTEW